MHRRASAQARPARWRASAFHLHCAACTNCSTPPRSRWPAGSASARSRRSSCSAPSSPASPTSTRRSTPSSPSATRPPPPRPAPPSTASCTSPPESLPPLLGLPYTAKEYIRATGMPLSRRHLVAPTCPFGQGRRDRRPPRPRRCDPRRHHQRARGRPVDGDLQRRLRPHAQPVGPAAHRRRLERRRGCHRRQRRRRLRPRRRRRRIDPHPRRVLRLRRPQADRTHGPQHRLLARALGRAQRLSRVRPADPPRRGHSPDPLGPRRPRRRRHRRPGLAAPRPRHDRPARRHRLPARRQRPDLGAPADAPRRATRRRGPAGPRRHARRPRGQPHAPRLPDLERHDVAVGQPALRRDPRR